MGNAVALRLARLAPFQCMPSGSSAARKQKPFAVADERAALVARDNQVADLDLLTVMQVRQLADRLCARASERIPPRRSQMPSDQASPFSKACDILAINVIKLRIM